MAENKRKASDIMDTNKFIEVLKEKAGGKIDNEGVSNKEGMDTEIVFGRFPRLLTDYKGYFIKFDFIISTELLFEINTPPPHRLLVCPETMVSRLLDKMCLSPEVKIGDSSFDKKYLIQYAEPEMAKKILSDEGKKIITELEPFIKFEMTGKEYKLLKNLEKKDYSPDDAMADMDRLILFVELCKNLEPHKKETL